MDERRTQVIYYLVLYVGIIDTILYSGIRLRRFHNFTLQSLYIIVLSGNIKKYFEFLQSKVVCFIRILFGNEI